MSEDGGSGIYDHRSLGSSEAMPDFGQTMEFATMELRTVNG